MLVAAKQFLLVEKMLKKTLVIALLTLLPAADYVPPDVFDGVQVACFARPGKNKIMLFSTPCSNNPRSADGTDILKVIIYLIIHIVRVRNYITGNTF